MSSTVIDMVRLNQMIAANTYLRYDDTIHHLIFSVHFE